VLGSQVATKVNNKSTHQKMLLSKFIGCSHMHVSRFGPKPFIRHKQVGRHLHIYSHAWSHDHKHPIKWMGNYITKKKKQIRTWKGHIPTLIICNMY